MRRWAGVSPRTRRLAPPSAGHSVCAKGLDFRPSASSPTPRAHGELHGGGTAAAPGKRWEQHLTLGARGRVSSGAFVPAAAWRRPASGRRIPVWTCRERQGWAPSPCLRLMQSWEMRGATVGRL